MTADGRPRPEAFFLRGGDVGCLLLHGFTGSPPEMRPLGDYLHARGLTVSGPLLAGHGTQPSDLNRVTWEDWLATAEEAWKALRAQCQPVFVAGLSLGALLTVHLSIMYPEARGIILLSPALRVANSLIFLAPVLKHVIAQFPTSGAEEAQYADPEATSRMWHYPTYPVGGAAELLRLQRVVRRELGDVRAPALVFCTRDATIHPSSAQELFDGLGSAEKELITLNNSG
ncbi:MAG: alpha/beta fold hydrolase, partial [Anaerolineae bacterium]|nr:alpha/beta fold hydrolase [Anaerolineae bacterium]